MHSPDENTHLNYTTRTERPNNILRRRKRKNHEESRTSTPQETKITKISLGTTGEESIERTPRQTKNYLSRKARKSRRTVQRDQQTSKEEIEESNISSINDDSEAVIDERMALKRTKRHKRRNGTGDVSDVKSNDEENTFDGRPLGEDGFGGNPEKQVGAEEKGFGRFC